MITIEMKQVCCCVFTIRLSINRSWSLTSLEPLNIPVFNNWFLICWPILSEANDYITIEMTRDWTLCIHNTHIDQLVVTHEPWLQFCFHNRILIGNHNYCISFFVCYCFLEWVASTDQCQTHTISFMSFKDYNTFNLAGYVNLRYWDASLECTDNVQTPLINTCSLCRQ